MTYEKQLDESLEYLRDHIAPQGTFLYYDKRRAEYNNQEHYLLKRLKEINVEEHFWLPMIHYLRDDGYIQFAYDPLDDEIKGNPPNQIKITFKGIMFINNGGYTQQKINRESKNIRLVALETNQRRHWNQMFSLTLILAASALATMIYYMVDLYWKHGWFQSRFWWTLSVVVVVLGALTSYLIWKLLPPKKQRKQ